MTAVKKPNTASHALLPVGVARTARVMEERTRVGMTERDRRRGWDTLGAWHRPWVKNS